MNFVIESYKQNILINGVYVCNINPKYNVKYRTNKNNGQFQINKRNSCA